MGFEYLFDNIFDGLGQYLFVCLSHGINHNRIVGKNNVSVNVNHHDAHKSCRLLIESFILMGNQTINHKIYIIIFDNGFCSYHCQDKRDIGISIIVHNANKKSVFFIIQ